jgi:hypothetical protein
MTGSEKAQPTSVGVENQLPLKGFSGSFKDVRTKRVLTITGMGDGRYLIATPKRQPKQK